MDAEETRTDLQLAAAVAKREAALYVETQRLKRLAEDFNRQLKTKQAA